MRLKLRWLLVAGVVVGVGAALGFRRSMARVAALLAGASRTAKTSFGTMEYGTLGEGAPVLVLHGAGGGFNQGLDMTAPLAGKGYRLVAPSRFGYFGSDLPDDPSPARQANACAELLDTLRIRQTVVITISAGAWSGLHFAARYPERCRALILLVPATKLPDGVKMYGGVLARTLFRSDLLGWLTVKLATAFPRFGASLMGTPMGLLTRLSSSEKRRIRQVLNDCLPANAIAAGMKLDIAAAHADDAFAMANVACPVLAISAHDDAFGTAARAREIADTVPNGRLLLFPSGGHLLVERHEEALKEITAFLAPLR